MQRDDKDACEHEYGIHIMPPAVKIKRVSLRDNMMRHLIGLGTCQWYSAWDCAFSTYSACVIIFPIGNLNSRWGLMLPSPTILRAVSYKVIIMARRHEPDAMQRNQKIQRQPALAPILPPKRGPTIGAVVILTGQCAISVLDFEKMKGSLLTLRKRQIHNLLSSLALIHPTKRHRQLRMYLSSQSKFSFMITLDPNEQGPITEWDAFKIPEISALCSIFINKNVTKGILNSNSDICDKVDCKRDNIYWWSTSHVCTVTNNSRKDSGYNHVRRDTRIFFATVVRRSWAIKVMTG